MNKMSCMADQHIHSDNSPDGSNSVMLLCEKAIEKHIDCITITDHCEINEFYKDNYNIAVKQSFFDTKKAKEVFNGQIEILNGIELGQATYDIPLSECILDAFPFDVVLGSMHSIGNMQDFAFLDYNADNPHELLGRYFDELKKLAEWGHFNVLSHMTYPLRYIEGEFGCKIDLKQYQDKIMEIMRILIKKGIALEINTSGLREPICRTLPDIWCLRLYKEIGGDMITLGSDAHSGDDIASGFSEGIAEAKEAGFKGYTIFKAKKPVFIPF